MPEPESNDEAVEWLIAPETRFEGTTKDAAQTATLKSEGFLQAEAKGRADLAEAFKDADIILARFMPKLTDPALSRDAFRNSLTDDHESHGELHGRSGLMASRSERAKRKAAKKAALGVRPALSTVKRVHQSIYNTALSRIEKARGNASAGIPLLSSGVSKMLIHLYSLEGLEFEKAINENAAYVAKINVFHAAVRKRFGQYHQIFGNSQKHLTQEQLVHFETLSLYETQIMQAQAIVRAVAGLGDDKPLGLDLEREQEWDLGR